METRTEFSACLDEYEKLVIRMTRPRVVIDNAVCATATLVKIDSARRHGVLLEVVQILTDLNLSITKAYVSSDGRWNMDVFHVTDSNGNKLVDQNVINTIEGSIEDLHNARISEHLGLNVLELTGIDRVGLLSEIFAVLADLECDIVESKVWTHNGRFASVIYIRDKYSGFEIQDSNQISTIESRLKNVLRGDSSICTAARTCVSMAVTHMDRRLHQLMFLERDYDRKLSCGVPAYDSSRVSVMVQNWAERGYSIVSVQCEDRPKLLFDVVCTLTDMDYVIFHAMINTASNKAYLEFYIKHKDGSPISSEPERQRVIQCLQASVERRASKGVRLELRTMDRPRLLVEVTRTFRENGLNVAGAEISTTRDIAMNVFHVTDAQGAVADPVIIESVRQEIGLSNLKVKEPRVACNQKAGREDGHTIVGVGGAVLVSLGSMVRRNLYNLGLIKSCS